MEQMTNLREVLEIQKLDNLLYLYYSHSPVARTKEFADGEINVDLDSEDQVVGIEFLSFRPEDIGVLRNLSSRYRLSFESISNSLNRPEAKLVIHNGYRTYTR